MSGKNSNKGPLPPLMCSCTKAEMLKWLQESDIPDDAELTIGHYDGCFKLWWRWSFLAGAFGDDFVQFDKAESDMLKREIEENNG